MSESVRWLNRLLSVALACILRLLGGWDAALSLLFLSMGLDVLTGFLCALHRKSDKTEGGGFLSRSFFLGLTRKLMVLALVILAAALDRMMGTDGVARLSVIGFYTANEGLSILENAALLGLPLPGALTAALERLREGGGENKERTEKMK